VAKTPDIKAEVEITSPTKPGVKTTEFWKSIAVHLVALMVIAFGIFKGSDGLVGFGSILMGLTQGSYNIGRSMAKKGASEAVAALLKGRDE